MLDLKAWYCNNDTVVSMGYWLLEEHQPDISAKDLLYFFEKPWKYEEEYKLYQQYMTEQER